MARFCRIVAFAQKHLHRFSDACMKLARQIAQSMLHLAQMLVLALEVEVHRARSKLALHLTHVALDARAVAKFCAHVDSGTIEALGERFLLVTLDLRREWREAIYGLRFVRMYFDDEVPCIEPRLVRYTKF